MASCGIDLGGTKCLGVILDGGEVVAQTRVPTPRGTDAVVDALVGVVDALGGPSALDAVGVGAPGLVDRTGALQVAPNLAVDPGLELRSVLEDRLGLAVVVDNDATCAAWGERELGAARGFDDVILVTQGTGIGGGIIVGGRVHRGANGFAGEIGHMVVDPQGPPCPCGQRGCWERFASGSGLGRLGREAAARPGTGTGAGRMVELAGGEVEAIRGEHVTAALGEGDTQAAEVMERFAWWTALGLANLANIFDPQVFVLGGGLAMAGEAFLAPTRAAFHDLLMGADWRPAARIVAPELGHRAGAIGAAGLAAGSR
ncbi:MAG: ROK family protein [Actinomycetota bacterium]|nr:ROK family protein [Actinomycetota bacterium]